MEYAQEIIPGIYEEEKRLIQQAERQGKLVLFVGAGASIPSGLPAWKKAINLILSRLNDYIDKEKDISSEALKIPQYYFNKYGEHDYKQLMYQIFRRNDFLETNEIHKLIFKFKTSHIITTNYDCLLEQAAKESHQFVYVIKQDRDIPYRTSEKEIIKMHGDFEHANFVLKEDDYLQYEQNFKLIETYVKSLIAGNVVLFIGYSFNDPDVKHIFSWLRYLLKGDLQRAYIIITGEKSNILYEEYFKNLGLNVIYSDKIIRNINDYKQDEQLEHILTWLQKRENDQYYEDFIVDYINKTKWLNYIPISNISNLLFPIGSILNDKLQIRNIDFFYDNKGKLTSFLAKTLINSIYLEDTNGGTNISANIRIQNNRNKLCDIVYSFDIIRLLELQKELKYANSNYFELAYISFILGDYLSAANILKNSADFFYQKNMFHQYFMSYFNRKLLCEAIEKVLFSDNDYKEKRKLIDELKNINLDEILNSIYSFNSISNDYSELEILADFNFVSNTLSSLYRFRKEIYIKDNENELLVNNSVYENLKTIVKDYFNYINYNYFLIEQLRDNLDIFDFYSNIVFEVVSLPTQADDRENLYEKQLVGLDDFDVFVILRYMKFETFIIRAKNKLNKIILNTSALEYINEILMKNDLLSDVYNEDIIFKIMVLTSNFLNDNLINKIIKLYLRNIEYSFSSNKQYCLKYFLNRVYCYLKKKNIDDIILMNMNRLITNIINISSKNVVSYERVLDKALSIICLSHKYYEDYVISELLLSDNYKDISVVYKYTSEKYKELIRNKYKDWECDYTNENDIEKLSKLIVNDIIVYNEVIENKLIEELDKDINIKLLLEATNESSNASDTLKTDAILSLLLYLITNNKAIDKVKLVNSLRKMDISLKQKWIIEPDTFDYNKFDLSWLKLVPISFLQEKVFFNKTTKNKLAKKIKNKYFNNQNVDAEIMQIYFKYLDN